MNENDLDKKNILDETTLSKNLNTLMKLKGIRTPSELASLINVPSASLYRLRDPVCNPTLSSLKRVAEFFKVSVSQLIGEEGLPLTLDQVCSQLQKIPTIGLNDAINFITKRIKPSEKEYAVESRFRDNVFVVIMEGNSMSPMFPSDTVLIMDPEQDLHDKCYALIHLHKHSQCVFKQILMSNPNIFLKSINPEIPEDDVIKLDKKDKIIAVLVQSRIMFEC